MNAELKQYVETIPAVAASAAGKETFWLNDRQRSEAEQRSEQKPQAVSAEMIQEASDRLERFAPYLAKVFPETAVTNGIIESPLKEISHMKQWMETEFESELHGTLLLKMDSHLPIAGSIKARGGIYEVLQYAEKLAFAAGKLREEDDYAKLAEPEFTAFFHQYTIQVGSTGNLGMSIGIMSAKLGFQVVVHMSADAKQWKKDLLRDRGVTVLEYETDYCAAVEEGRKHSDLDPMSYFVDDEKSVDLFLGYSVAGARVKQQLEEQKLPVDQDHPLFVYLPCGIGGAPGGVAYGLKEQYGDHVHCFFTEPVQACCMLLGMATGLHDQVCVNDFGLCGLTEADGLAVGRPSAFVGKVMEQRLSGICTIQDTTLYQLMSGLLLTEDIFIEPSACACFAAFLQSDVLQEYIKAHGLEDKMDGAVHIAWATGGSMVPEEMKQVYLEKAKCPIG